MPSVPAHEFRFKSSRLVRCLMPLVKMSLLATPLLAIESTRPWGYVTLAIGVLMTLLMLRIYNRGVAVAVDANGLRVSHLGFGMLPWSEIAAVRFVRVDSFSHLVVDRTPSARTAHRGSFLLRRFAKRCGAKDLAVPLVELRDDPKRVCEVVALSLAIANGGGPTIRR